MSLLKSLFAKRPKATTVSSLNVSLTQESTILAGFVVAALWAVHAYLLPPLAELGEEVPFGMDAFRRKLFDSGPIPLLILGTFFYGAFYLTSLVQTLRRVFFSQTEGDRKVIETAKAKDFKALGLAIQKSEAFGYTGSRIAQLYGHWIQGAKHHEIEALRNELLASDENDMVLSFVAVRWSEWMLPILGFLGTVLGLGDAIEEVQHGVQLYLGIADSAREASQQTAVDEAMSRFGNGFKGLGSAFDTTFFGLFGLIVVGGGHLLCRKRLATLLTKRGQRLAELTNNWPQFEPLTAPVSLTHLDLAPLVTQLEKWEGMFLFAADRDPKLHHFADALFGPRVRFAKSDADLFRSVDEHIRSLGGATLECLCSANAPCRDIVIGLKPDTGRSRLLFADTNGFANSASIDVPPSNVAISPDGSFVLTLGKDKKTRAHVIEHAGSEINLGAPIEISVPLDRSRLVQLGSEPGPGLLYLDFERPNTFLRLLTADHLTQPKESTALDPNVKWVCLAYREKPREVLILGHETKNMSRVWRMDYIELTAQGEWKPKTRQLGALHGDLEPSLYTLNDGSILILSNGRELSRWDQERARLIRLQHDQWPDQGSIDAIFPGHGGSFGVLTKKRLTMWSIGPLGKLHLDPMSDSLPVSLAPDRLTADSVGRFIFGIDEEQVFAWRVPGRERS